MRAVDTTDLCTPSARRVLIAGGGYAGITLATTLANRMRESDDIEIVLVDPRPFQQALSELDLVAAGTSRPQFAELWHASIFRDLPINVCYDRLEAVHMAENSVDVGPRENPTARIPYWRLVIATGAVASVPPVPGTRRPRHHHVVGGRRVQVAAAHRAPVPQGREPDRCPGT